MGESEMIRLSDIVKQFATITRQRYSLLPSQLKAISAWQICRTGKAPLMQLRCNDCEQPRYVPHSCGHRHCPHCQHHQSQQWLARQLQKQLPARYFMLTFTLPAELRSLAWQHQRVVYDQLLQCSWATLKQFSHNDKQLQGMPGSISVLHTHNRRLDYHPHVHVVMPATAIDQNNMLRKKSGRKGWLFSQRALAKTFRAKLLAAIKQAGFTLPADYPGRWVVHCKSVGTGDKALTYLGRYLYRGVISEKDILRCKNGQVTFRYRDSKTQCVQIRTVSGEHFLWLLLQHVLPKGLRRARNFGLLHPNSRHKLQLIQLLQRFNPARLVSALPDRPAISCPCCGGVMQIVRTRLQPITSLISNSS
jgi:Putative transposase/Transposase zinc-binding domain